MPNSDSELTLSAFLVSILQEIALNQYDGNRSKFEVHLSKKDLNKITAVHEKVKKKCLRISCILRKVTADL